MTFLEAAKKHLRQKNLNNARLSLQLLNSKRITLQKYLNKILKYQLRGTAKLETQTISLQWKKLNQRRKFWENARHLLQFRNVAKVA